LGEYRRLVGCRPFQRRLAGSDELTFEIKKPRNLISRILFVPSPPEYLPSPCQSFFSILYADCLEDEEQKEPVQQRIAFSTCKW